MDIKSTLCEGVTFIESSIPSAQVIKHLNVEISRQNANLSDVKKLLAQKAKAIGATTIMNFRYGQKAHKWWELIFTLKWDTESWYGEGDAVNG